MTFQLLDTLPTKNFRLFLQPRVLCSLENVEENNDESQEGQYKVTLIHTYMDGETEEKYIYTDAIFNKA